MMMMQRRGKMKVEKSDDCRSKPLESEDGMTSAAQVRETDPDRRNTNSSSVAASTGRKKGCRRSKREAHFEDSSFLNEMRKGPSTEMKTKEGSTGGLK